MSSCFNSIKVRLRQAFFLSDGNELRFQFHKGSIKTSCRSRSCSRTTSFNSIKVRLRRLPLQGSCDSSDRFQFHKGSIKTRLQAVYQLPSRSFNSIKVRLRPSCPNCASSRSEFQFHKGSIKTFSFRRLRMYE